MMGHLGILLFASPIQHRSTDTAIALAEAASRQGHRVTVFLLADAVYCSSRALLTAPEEGAVHRLSRLPASADVVNCSTCARFRGLGDESSIISNARNGTLEDLVELVRSADRFLAFTGES
jgi:sulfur relay (sulfurtransferase) complex TusBCD TusD component (DsrE family)